MLGCLTVSGDVRRKCAANPGLTPGFRRSLPETGCLSQGLPRGIRGPFVVSPKRSDTPDAAAGRSSSYRRYNRRMRRLLLLLSTCALVFAQKKPFDVNALLELKR